MAGQAAGHPRGTCEGMCSEVEIAEREACLELNPLEILQGTEAQRRPRPDLTLAVKRYQRPAAGKADPLPAELRTTKALERTVEHLLKVWNSREDLPQLTRYLFISDRLRAVAQELLIQQLSLPFLLAKIARFHLFVEVAFSDVYTTQQQAERAGYSPVLNRAHLCNALISAFEIRSQLPEHLYAELLSYFILLHADQPHVITPELATTPAPVLDTPIVRQSLRLATAFARFDVVDFSRQLYEAPLLCIGAALRLLPELRATVLAHANKAYMQREAILAADICPRLLLPAGTDLAVLLPQPQQASGAHAARLAAAHGLLLQDGAIRFRSPDFSLIAASLELPLPPPPLPCVTEWLQHRRLPEDLLATGLPDHHLGATVCDDSALVADHLAKLVVV